MARLFPEGKCHHRNAAGVPDCKKDTVRASANLCKDHEAEWQAGKYRARRDTAYGSGVESPPRAPRARKAPEPIRTRKAKAPPATQGRKRLVAVPVVPDEQAQPARRRVTAREAAVSGRAR